MCICLLLHGKQWKENDEWELYATNSKSASDVNESVNPWNFGYAQNCGIPTTFEFGFKLWYIPTRNQSSSSQVRSSVDCTAVQQPAAEWRTSDTRTSIRMHTCFKSWVSAATFLTLSWKRNVSASIARWILSQNSSNSYEHSSQLTCNNCLDQKDAQLPGRNFSRGEAILRRLNRPIPKETMWICNTKFPRKPCESVTQNITYHITCVARLPREIWKLKNHDTFTNILQPCYLSTVFLECVLLNVHSPGNIRSSLSPEQVIHRQYWYRRSLTHCTPNRQQTLQISAVHSFCLPKYSKHLLSHGEVSPADIKRRPECSRPGPAWPSWQAEMSEREGAGTTGRRCCHAMRDDVASHTRHSSESDSTRRTHTAQWC